MADTVSVESGKVAESRGSDGLDSMDLKAKSVGYRSVDLFFSLLTFLPASVILAFFYILMKILNGWNESFLLRSHRVGYHGKSFTKLKIRTTRFAKVNGSEESRLENLRLGSIIRSTRLDALPQIWNVLRGDMAWIGPRAPRKMNSFSLRSFGVKWRSPLAQKPGIMRVYSVATSIEKYPHVAGLFERRAMRVQNSFFLYVSNIIYRGISFSIRLIRQLLEYTFRRLFTSRKGGENRRILRIVNPKGVEFYLYNSSMDKKILYRALAPNDINYEAMSFEMPELLEEERSVGIEWKYEQRSALGRNTRKTIRGSGYLKRKQIIGNSSSITYVLFYQASSPLDRYLMDFYILRDSLR